MKKFKEDLIIAYNADAKRRDCAEGKRDKWKLGLRQYFSDLLEKEDKHTLLEIGAGAGLDSQFFKDKGFDVLATDLSNEMVRMCIKRDIKATVLDLYNLDKLKRKFDAIYALNVLLHVPKRDLNKILNTIWNSLNENGVFFYGVYGGMNEEKVITDKSKMDLPRFFSFLSDETLLEAVKAKFDVIKFETIDIGSKNPKFHFQSLFLRKNFSGGE